MISSMDIDFLVIKQQAISNKDADLLFVVGDLCHQEMIHLRRTASETKIGPVA